MHNNNNIGDTWSDEFRMSTFSESFPSSVITNEPTISRNQAEPGPRMPIPVSTIDWNRSITSHFTPLQGLDFLFDVQQLIVQQTVELTDLMSTMASENRYTVKVPREDTIFYATESSTSFQRTCFGSGRGFTMKLFDSTQQEAMEFRRKLACGSCCSIFCYLQEIEVWIPPGQYVGRIAQNFSLTKPYFSIYNKDNEIIYYIEGPDSLLGCVMSKAYNFHIYNADGVTQVGSIIHQWDQIEVGYNLFIQMPGNEQNNRYKALLLASAFLLEYMYFENAKRKSCKCIC